MLGDKSVVDRIGSIRIVNVPACIPFFIAGIKFTPSKNFFLNIKFGCGRPVQDITAGGETGDGCWSFGVVKGNLQFKSSGGCAVIN